MIESKQSLTKKKQFTIQKYKKRLLVQVIIIFLICFIVILQRVFYQMIINAQEKTISSLQINTGMIKQKNKIYVPDAINNGFLQFFGMLSRFPIIFLLITHVFCTLYVAFDAFLTAKLLYMTMIVIYIVSLLQIFYEGQRPFWQTNQILTSICLQSYNHPNLGTILMLFIPFYGYYCWMKKTDNFSLMGKSSKHIAFLVGTFLITGFVQFLNYFIGTMYILNIAISFALGILFIVIVYAGEALIQNAIKRSTIMITQAKKNIFYWLMLISLFSVIVLIIYTGQNLFLDINWIQNFMACTRYLQYPNKVYNYDQIIGPLFNIVQTSSLFGWLGAIFGISICFRKFNNVNWADGSMNKKILRIIIGNIFIIPSWIFILVLQNKGNWIKNIGLNIYLVNSIHFFLLYLWIFGYMPIIIFNKLLKIINKKQEDFYILMEDRKDKK